MTASEMFGVPVKGMPAEVRRRAKAINFGIIYGISAFGLANQLGIAREEAARLHQALFRTFSRHPRLYRGDQAFAARTHGFVEDPVRPANATIPRSSPQTLDPRLQRARRDQRALAGHCRRHHPPRHGPDGRCAWPKAGFRRSMLLQVHDELIFEVPDEEVEADPAGRATHHGKRADAGGPISVPLHVDARAADNWDEAH